MHKSHGFTLIELMVVVAIAAILSAVAAPSLKRLIQSTTMSSNVNTFLADMRYARSESIRRGGGVVMCRSDDPEAASPICGSGSGPNGNGWVSGWIIFHDLDNNGQKSAAETLLRVQSPITSINTIVEGGKGSSSTKFQFTATGRFYNLNSATKLTFGSPDLFEGSVQRTVCVSLSGRTRIAGDGFADCPKE
ncbi:MAG: prepilin-type N-terminal cleavage/methylation domain-containing protein [Glaciimonas sp.]|nr:prepilin-type N-terminal cleavage/methylation domain-containing protein [Glaciimonas sp.]